MKKILLALSLMISTSAYGASDPTVDTTPQKQPTITVDPLAEYRDPKQIKVSLPCDHFMVVFDIMKKSKESLLFTADGYVNEATTGRSYPGGIYIWANIDTGTASIAIMFADGHMCLLAPGSNFTTYRGAQPWDKPKAESF